jgi:flagellar hook-basal body complex protein FliE
MDWDNHSMSFIPKDEMSESDMKFIESISVSQTEFGTSKQMRTMAREKVRALETLSRLLGYDKQEAGETPQFITTLKAAFKQLDAKRDAAQAQIAAAPTGEIIGVKPISAEEPK